MSSILTTNFKTRSWYNAAMSKLTPRERQALQLCAGGMSDKQIAAELGITYQTARNHLNRIARQYGTSGRVQAVVHGIGVGDVVLWEALQAVDKMRQEAKKKRVR